MMDTTGKRRHKQAGMASLQQVLLLVMIAGLALPPLLSLMVTNMKAGQMEERKTKEFYAADAGVTAALWRIKTNYKLDWLNSYSGRWREDIYGHNPPCETYTLPLAPNGNSVVYTIAPRWILEGLETPGTTQLRNPADNVKVYGSYNGTGTNGLGSYKILMYYDGHAPEGSVGIDRIGCWLPAGLEYAGNCSLEATGSPVKTYIANTQVNDFRGGHSIVWNFKQAVDFNLFSPGGTTKEITFEFTPNESRQGGFCWARSNTISNYLAWSALNIFEVKSTATSPAGETTTATSYSIRNVGDTFGSVIEGDYYAFGNTLMRDPEDPESQLNKYRLYEKTRFTVTAIPSNAQVEYIFLYWTGWKCKPWDGLTAAQLKATDPLNLPNKYNVNKVSVTCNTTVSGPRFSDNITASVTQAQINYLQSDPQGWGYSCFADITDQVKTYFKNNGVDFRGNATYTIGHWDVRPGATAPTNPVGPWYQLYNFNYSDYSNHSTYDAENIYGWTLYPLGSPMDGGQTNYEGPATTTPHQHLANEGTGSPSLLSYGAWSIIIVYTSPSTLGRQLYKFDTLAYGATNKGYPWPRPPDATISGFIVPDLTDETNAAKITCFVGEGDVDYSGDSMVVNGATLPSIGDATRYPANNVWNSASLIPGPPDVAINGTDIDTWNLSKSIIKPGDTSATLRLPTSSDQWNLIYIILAFRSKITGGGSFIYDIR